MAVQHTLGVASCAAGVAQAGGGVFVKLGPAVGAGLGCQPVFVADQVGNATVGRQFVGIAQGHPAFHRGTFAVHCCNQWCERGVETHHRVFSVVDDPGQLLRVQARVQRVQHALRAADTKVQLQVAVAIPGQGGHAVAVGQLVGIQCIGNLARTLGHLRPVGTVNVALHSARHDFTVRVVAFGVLDERRNEQRVVLHLSKHGFSCLLCE